MHFHCCQLHTVALGTRACRRFHLLQESFTYYINLCFIFIASVASSSNDICFMFFTHDLFDKKQLWDFTVY